MRDKVQSLAENERLQTPAMSMVLLGQLICNSCNCCVSCVNSVINENMKVQ